LILFAMKLHYKNGDPLLHTDYTGGANSNWNGNITMLEWQVNNTAHRMYGFFYDGRNQLRRGESGTRTNNAASPVLNTNYKTDYTYDNAGLSSNLKTVTRRGLLSGTSTFGIIDQMTYTYNTAGQLTQIGEAGSSTKGFKTPGLGSYTYTYDLNGNMSRDNHKNMTVAYNHLNLPRLVLFDNGNEIRLTYTAAGEKITKFTAANTGVETTQNYVSGIEYNGIAVEAVYHEEGRLVPNGTAWHYEYTLKDHLGNSRVMFRANGATAQLLQENHYYPFGMEMEGAWTAQVGTENKYQYNGKELVEDFGWNWSDYGARGYDASVGRWWSVDPMAEAYHSLSVYHYGLNNPIANVDLFGMMSSNPNDIYKERAEKGEARRKETDEQSVESPIFDENGNFLGTDSEGFKGDIVIMPSAVYNKLTNNGKKTLDHKFVGSLLAKEGNMGPYFAQTLDNYVANDFDIESSYDLDFLKNVFTNLLSAAKDEGLISYDVSNLAFGKIGIDNDTEKPNGDAATHTDAGGGKDAISVLIKPGKNGDNFSMLYVGDAANAIHILGVHEPLHRTYSKKGMAGHHPMYKEIYRNPAYRKSLKDVTPAVKKLAEKWRRGG